MFIWNKKDGSKLHEPIGEQCIFYHHQSLSKNTTLRFGKAADVNDLLMRIVYNNENRQPNAARLMTC